ncbi:MAG: hypothetical protein MJE68_24700 [Proteobacteria bacterium]|nr:hypothetical protein [Pseudomonadota bacterium]
MAEVYGKWSESGVPHKGWNCVGVTDLESPSAICQMCERKRIRYVHYMEHPDYDVTLAVGCVCAGNMEEDYVAAKNREKGLVSNARRKEKWLQRNWKISAKGNSYIKTRDGFHVVTYKKYDGTWGARITNCMTGEVQMSKGIYSTEDAVKLAAFDAMVFLKKRGWGR